MGRWMTILAWVMVAPFAVWALIRVLGWDAGFRWVQLVSFTPYVAAASLVVPLVALVLRRWTPAIAGLVVAAVLISLVAPRAFAKGNPQANGPTLRILGANILHGKTPAEQVVALARELKVDFLAMQELTDESVAAIERAGVKELFPYVVVGTRGTSLYSKYPLGEAKPSPSGLIRADVKLPGRDPIEVASVHTVAPLDKSLADPWAQSQRDLPPATPDGQIRILAGDFNATLDHASMRKALKTGYRDAAKVRGSGFTPTWPADGRFVPGIVIDHVFADERVAVLDYSVHRLERSDHNAVFAALRLP